MWQAARSIRTLGLGLLEFPCGGLGHLQEPTFPLEQRSPDSWRVTKDVKLPPGATCTSVFLCGTETLMNARMTQS